MADPFAQKHGGNLAAAASSYGGGAFLDFSANINPHGVPENVMDAIVQALRDGALEHYPDPRCTALVKALCLRHGVEESDVLCGNGVSELLSVALETLKRGSVAVHAPAFSEYAASALIAGHSVEYIPLESEAWEAGLNLRRFTGAILANPNNPTSRPLSEAVLISFLERCEWVILDEAFVELCSPGTARSYLDLIDKYPNLIVMRAFTKSLALPGLRLGYAIAHEKHISSMRARQIPWSVNALAQSIAPALSSLSHYEEKTRQWLSSEPRWLYGRLEALEGVKAWAPAANFILCRLSGGRTAPGLAHSLAKRGILIRVAANFEGLDETYFRVAVKRRADNERLLGELRGILGGKG